MSEFDYKVISRPGIQNGNADALSRIPNQPEETQEIDDEPQLFEQQHCDQNGWTILL